MATVEVELPGGEGIVRGDDGEIMLAWDVTLGSGQPLQPWDRYQTLRVGLSDDRMLFGGLLPPGAVSVEAVEASGVRKVAAVGGGSFAVIFQDGQHGDPALGFRDAAGAFVSRPMPGVYPHQPVGDADEPCPVCGAVQYEEYFPTEWWRAGSGTKGTDSFAPSPLVVCRVCGHEEQSGANIRLGRTGDAQEEEHTARAESKARIRAQATKKWHADKRAITAATFPIYAAEGWPARVVGSGSQNDDLTHLVVGHAETLPDSMFLRSPRIEITTSIDPHQPGALAIAREVFAGRIRADADPRPSDGLSDAALMLRSRAARRRRVASAHDVSVSELEITVDGAHEPWLAVGTPNALWVAVRRHHDVTLTITAREIDPASLRLGPIADPQARLLGPEPDQP